MSRLTPVLKLNTVNRSAGVWMVVGVITVSGLLSLLAGVVLHVVLGAPLGAVAEGLRYNQVLLWWPGIALLVHAAQVIGTSTPLALALGTTRRSMWWGSVLTFVLHALLAAAVLTVFLLLERATGGWFLGLPAFDVHLFAGGSPAWALLVAFLVYLGAQLVGAVFATVYVRGGPVALTLSIIGTVVTTLAVLVWAAATGAGSAAAVGAGSAGVPAELVLLAAAAPVLLALLGWGLYRRVSVR
ncbi:hypothetical protein E7Z53_04920 [Kocuria salina]|uniref:hypothetical protein n=1 Tax=Kocuria salina TaxID=1929416 RepID=UPI001592E20F|nr:hypothetical protein [Kocuria salina]NVC22797.1 hypothetical protein [Kocuria salina]